MARRQTHTTTVDPDAFAHLTWLKTALRRQNVPGKVDNTDILSALVLYTPPPQLAGMLAEYAGYNQAVEEADAAGQPKPPRYPPSRWPQ
jgi:hypothetical protein